MRPGRLALRMLVALGLGGTVAADHLLGRGADDWSRHDHQTVTVTAVLAGDALQLADGTHVRLLGIADPISPAIDWLQREVVGQRVTLLLPLVGTRDDSQRLLAYVCLADGSCVNVRLVHDGLAYADRRAPDVMAGLIDAAETDARRKGRGLWDGLRLEQMPEWRRAWLRSRAASRP